MPLQTIKGERIRGKKVHEISAPSRSHPFTEPVRSSHLSPPPIPHLVNLGTRGERKRMSGTRRKQMEETNVGLLVFSHYKY